MSNLKIRKLTPLECERLQSYPDNWTSKGIIDKKEVSISNTQRYKLCGNGITSLVSKEIIEHLVNFHKGPVKVMSTFSGCGGTELFLNNKRFNIVGHSEIDKYASAVLKYHYPDIPNFGDITKIKTKELPDFDLLTGGFSCQAFSIAGKRGGFNDTRGTLFFELAKILKDKQPSYFVFENVKGLLSHDKGKTLTTIISTFDDLGYDFDFQVVNSKNFGVPQNRERIFICGFKKELNIQWYTPVNKRLIVPVCKRFKDALNINNLVDIKIPLDNCLLSTTIEDILETTVDPKYYLRSDIISKIANEANWQNKIVSLKTDKLYQNAKKETYCLDANYYKGTNTTSKSRRQLVAYSNSTRKTNIDHRARLGQDSNTLSCGDGCGNMSSKNFIVEEE